MSIIKDKFSSINSLQTIVKLSISYNNVVLRFISKNLLIDSFKLIPIISDEYNLRFIQNTTIIIDASASYDQMLTNDLSTYDKLLNFTWQCFGKFNSCSSTNSNKLIIEPKDYITQMTEQDLNINQIFTFKVIY